MRRRDIFRFVALAPAAVAVRASPEPAERHDLDHAILVRGIQPGEMFSGEALREMSAALIEYQRGEAT